MYAPVLVSIRTLSPSLIKSGTLVVIPFSKIASLKTLVAEFPLTPGAVSDTVKTILDGRFKDNASDAKKLFKEYYPDFVITRVIGSKKKHQFPKGVFKNYTIYYRARMR